MSKAPQMQLLAQTHQLQDVHPHQLGFSLRMVPLNPVVGDLAGNKALILDEIGQAEADGIELLLLPELVLCGYPSEDLLLREDFLSACAETLAEIAAASEQTTTILGAPLLDKDGRLYNSAVVLAEGRCQAIYHKQQLPNYGVFDEKRYFAPGDHPLVIEIGAQQKYQVGVTICEDIWVPHTEPVNSLAQLGLDLVVNISASPYHRAKSEERQQLIQQRSAEVEAPIAYCNQLGGQDELVFDGHCLLVDGTRLLAEAPSFKGNQVDYPTSASLPEPFSPTEEVYQALVLGVRDYIRKTGFKEVVLGLSGGIDSALVLLVAVDALGAENVHAVVMPSPHSSADTQGDARAMAANLGAACLELPIGELMDGYQKLTEPLFIGLEEDVTEENIQARIRGNLLMALSNKFNWLLLSTGNKSEWAVGYATLYGDMAGGFAVIRDLPKTQVFELTRWRAELGDFKMPMGIIERPPSAELKPDQADTDSLPPYEILDPILEHYIEEALGPQEIIALGFEQDVVKRVLWLVDSAEYKRRQGPLGPKITTKSFGRDRRLPIVNRFR